MPAPSTTLFPSNSLFPSEISANPYSKTGEVIAGAQLRGFDKFTAVDAGSGRSQAVLSGTARKISATGTTYTKTGSVLITGRLSGSRAAPPTVTDQLLTIPVPTIEIAFTGNPTATYADIQYGQDGSVSFWRMNSATTFFDELAVNNGTIIGTPTTTASPYSYDTDLALQFDGSADGAYVTSSLGLVSKSDMTAAGWLRIDSLPAGTRDIVAKRGAWVLQVTSAGKLVWTLKDDTSTATVTSNTTLVAGTWYHVAAVYDSASILLYINGVLDVTTAYSAGWEAGTNPIRFAQTPSSMAPTWQSSTTASGIGTTATGTKPASVASGDFLLAYIHAGVNSQPTITTAPSGWTLLESRPNSGGGQFIATALYYKVAGGSEPASYSWDISTNVTWIATVTRITGVDTLAPIANPVWSTATNGTSHPAGSHTPDVDNALVMGFFSIEAPAAWTVTGTERYDTANGSNSAALSTETVASPTATAVTGTSDLSDPGAAYWVALAGGTPTYATVSMKDWSFSDVARTASDVARDYAARSSGVTTWTNVTTSVRQFDVQGASRQYELDQMEAGTTRLVLKDENRYFDPANASSPYAPNVVPMRRIRGSTSYLGTVYDLWYTYIERWPPLYRALGYQEIDLTSVDGFDGLALAEVSGTLDVGFSGAQIDALLDKALWPKDKRALDTGQYVMAGQTLSGSKALAAIQEIANSERGIFFLDQTGVATFHDSAHRGTSVRSTTSQVTFIDSHSASGIFYQGLTPSFDKDKIVNEWMVVPDSSVFGAEAQSQVDPASVAQHFLRSGSRSTRLASNADALAQAGNLLNETSQPGLRFDSIKVLPTTTAAYQACLNLRISDRVTVIRGTTSGWDGPVITKDCFIEARQISVEPSKPWQFTFALSPVSLGNYYATIMRDGPVSYWRMDTTT